MNTPGATQNDLQPTTGKPSQIAQNARVGLPKGNGGNCGVDREKLTGKSQGDAGLSMYHISPQTPKAEKIGNGGKPKVTLWRGASLVTTELGKLKGQTGKSHDWKRGAITEFSKQSRRRILRIVATLKRDIPPQFVTMTYPDDFERNPRQVKKHLDNFNKRFSRKYPNALMIWRMEPQERKSGLNVGEIAPHFHMLIWGADYKSLLQWIPQTWFEIVGSGDKKHLMAGTRVERVRSTRGVMFYTAKYICKSLNYHLEGWGRYWGIVNRGTDENGKRDNHNLTNIQGLKTVIEIDNYIAKTLLRYMRRRASEIYKKGKFAGVRKFPKWGHKFTLVCGADFWESAIIKMQQ